MEREINIRRPVKPDLPSFKRVAAYVRVSNLKDAMLQSLSTQVSYYNDFIQRHAGWQYAGVYVDEGLTGTKDLRPEFQRLLADCRGGKIDMIITKSTTRFTRNTVTMLETVRMLKEFDVDVFFEKDYIKNRPYTTYGRFSSNITLYIAFSCGIVTLNIVPCRLLVA